MDDNEQKLVIERYNQCKEERLKYIPRWKDVEHYLAINSDINSEFEDIKSEVEDKDIFLNDPTGFVCINNAGDYLAGILWQNDMVTLEASDYIKEISGGNAFEEFFKDATTKFRKQMNHSDAGFSAVLHSYCYDQEAFATSGIGIFRSKEYDNHQSECCLDFKNYNVQNSCIDEGANNRISVVFTVYNWRLNKIIEEFCFKNGEFSQSLYNELPDDIKKSYEANRFNDRFKLVNGILPNNTFKINKRGKAGAKFKGYWFIDGQREIFKEEYFKLMPIAFCRAIRLANQVYGESHGTMAVTAVKMLNYVTGITVDNIDKITDPALGVISGALLAGHTLDRTAGAINTFNPNTAGGKDNNPVFSASPTGDISAVINFLIPLLKQDITNIFKLDQLLDFNNQTQMTATESSYRMSIRGKSISGLISQQKTEMLEPVIRRAISIMQECKIFGDYEKSEEVTMDLGELFSGVNNPAEIASSQAPRKDGVGGEILSLAAMTAGESGTIPEEIAQAMRDGKAWYEIKYTGELEKLANNELYSSLANFFQFLQFLLQINPQLVYAIDSYEFLDFCKKISNLDNENFVISKTAYAEVLAQIQEAQAQMSESAQSMQQAQALDSLASAQKQSAEANSINDIDNYLGMLYGNERGKL